MVPARGHGGPGHRRPGVLRVRLPLRPGAGASASTRSSSRPPRRSGCPRCRGRASRRCFRRSAAATPQRIGVGGWNIFPHSSFEDLKKGGSGRGVRAGRRPAPAGPVDQDRRGDPVHRRGVPDHGRGDEGGDGGGQARESANGSWRRSRGTEMLAEGAEGIPYPAWVCSGPHSPAEPLPLHRSRDSARRARAVHLRGEVHGLLRQHVPALRHRQDARPARASSSTRRSKRCTTRFGHPPRAKRPPMSSTGTTTSWRGTATRTSRSTARPTAPGTRRWRASGLRGRRTSPSSPNMLFNIDIWLSDGTYGMRYEDGVLVTGGRAPRADLLATRGHRAVTAPEPGRSVGGAGAQERDPRLDGGASSASPARTVPRRAPRQPRRISSPRSAARSGLEVEELLPTDVPGIRAHRYWLPGGSTRPAAGTSPRAGREPAEAGPFCCRGHADVAPFEPDNWKVCRPYEPLRRRRPAVRPRLGRHEGRAGGGLLGPADS